MTIWDALTAHADGKKHVMFFELRLSTGLGGSEQRIDAWSMPVWPSLGKGIVAYEIKENRSDFLRELKNPEKRLAAFRYSNQFAFVTTDKVVKDVGEIPSDCGWLLYKDYELVMMRDAPIRICPPPDWSFIRAVLRRGFDFEVIKLRRQIEMLTEFTRDDRKVDQVISLLGEWALEESGRGNTELVEKIKSALAPSGLYQWVGSE